MNAIERAWSEGGALAQALRPLGVLYRVAAAVRALVFRAGLVRVVPSPLPVVVVGNLTVGGTGKTPLTGHLLAEFRARGWRPGVVSRGYGGARHEHPRHVRADDVSADVGDEPLMLHRSSGAAVCVCVHRALAVAALARDTDCDLVLSDDGLQHHRMARDVEIVVVDAEHGLGNGRLLPAGPLREPATRLYTVDAVAVRGDIAVGSTPPLSSVPQVHGLDRARLPPAFRFSVTRPRLSTWPAGESVSLDTFAGRRVHALAGIARPERFFAMLRRHGLEVEAHPLPDHQALAAADLAFGDELPVLLTSKDAARLDGIAPLPPALHVVEIDIEIDAAGSRLIDALSDRLRARTAVSTAANGAPTTTARSMVRDAAAEAKVTEADGPRGAT